ncbi:MAG: hypothetical protein H8E37_06705, partial [Planctomycetes bacterium]|nr:hypothetical protein [Planctomycetota bacterium]
MEFSIPVETLSMSRWSFDKLAGKARSGAILLAILLLPAFSRADKLKRVPLETERVRGPVAVARLDKATAVVANRCGSVSVVDLAEWKVVSEFEVGGQLSDVGVSSGRVFVTDADGSRLVELEVSRKSARLLSETALPTHPVTVRVSADRSQATVASLWGRAVSVVDLSGTSPKVLASVPLRFAPREQLRIENKSRVIVADSFSGQLAVIDTKSFEVVASHEFGGHNIRGLAINGEGRLLISHQVLNHRAVPRRGDIIWGVMVDNMIREATLEKILDDHPKAMQGNRFISVGYAGQGAGDPDSMFVGGEGRTVIALSGVGEVSIVEPDGNGFRRVAVGRRPVAVMPLTSQKFVVVNGLSDSLSLVDLSEPEEGDEKPKAAGTASAAGDGEYDSGDRYSSGSYGSTYLDSGVAITHLPLGAAPKTTAAQRGERLFFDARLSHANWFSCHSCHTDGHTNGGMADTFGDDSTGAPKRVLSLLGVGETGPWGWNGKKNSLLAQIHQSTASTMKGRAVSKAEAADLATFLRTLNRPPRFHKPASRQDSALVTKGRGPFASLECSACHRGHRFTS